jgi:hypothetical protein
MALNIQQVTLFQVLGQNNKTFDDKFIKSTEHCNKNVIFRISRKPDEISEIPCSYKETTLSNSKRWL